MSQYPSPYAPPQPDLHGYAAGPDLMAAPRRAGLLMIVIGVMGMLLGGCLLGLSCMPAQFFDQIKAQGGGGGPTIGPQQAIVSSILFLIPSLLLVVVGALIRGGRRWAIVTGIVMASLAMAYFALNGVMLMAGGAQLGVVGAQLAIALCMFFVMIVLFGLLIWSLVAAMKSVGQLRQWQAQYAAQWYQYQQQVPPPPSEADDSTSGPRSSV